MQVRRGSEPDSAVIESSKDWNNGGMTFVVSELDRDLVRYARVLPLDIIQAKGNGHGGTAVSLAPVLTMLYQHVLRHDPADPHWLGRDRFVLSAGHTSLSLYLQLYLSGYGLEMSDLKAARSLGSLTPGHPELGHTDGVETTTGPLGQGFANAVGMAMDSRRLVEMLGGGPDSPFTYRVFTLVSDGDMMEGISHEAGALAGHLRLGNLVAIWDDNEICIEGPTGLVTSEDVAGRFAAYGWNIIEVSDAEDLELLVHTLREAGSRSATDAPTFIRLRTTIGYPMPNVGGTAGAHAGAPGEEEIRLTKQALGLDPDAHFVMPAELLDHARSVRERGAQLHRDWNKALEAWRTSSSAETVELYERLTAQLLPADLWNHIEVPAGKLATRQASAKVLAALGERLPEVWGGSADLTDTAGARLTKSDNLLAPGDTSGRTGGVGGRQIQFGIREHGMGSIVNGIAIGGLTRPFSNTYLAFGDYMRPSLRMASLMGIDSIFLFSHDSVAVGEDGPTHQPVEQIASLRVIPGLAVARPADNAEVLAVWRKTLETRDGPTAMVFSRQALPQLESSASLDGTPRGGYVVADVDADASAADGARAGFEPDAIVMATGSEVHLALAAARSVAESGHKVRVVSMPCVEWFEAQDAEYRESVLPAAVTARVSVEAGVASGWWKYLGTHGRAVSVETYGESGDGALVLERAGVSEAAVVEALTAVLA